MLKYRLAVFCFFFLIFGSFSLTNAQISAHKTCENYIKEKMKSKDDGLKKLVKLCDAAKNGDDNAGLSLGLEFIKPISGAMPSFERYEQAAKWFKNAADKNNAKGTFNLGVLYAKGWGVKLSDAKAFELFEKAAKDGIVNAQYNLGIHYSLGKGVPKDENLATDWYRKAAENGFAEAQYNLGIRYYKGIGAPKNFVSAYKWLNVASTKGLKRAVLAREIVGQNLNADQIKEAQGKSHHISRTSDK